MHRGMRLLSPLLALVLIILFAGMVNIRAQIEFEITKLECSPATILLGETVTIIVEIEGIPNKINNIDVSATTPTGLKSKAEFKITTDADGKGSGSVIYLDDFWPKDKTSTTELGEYTVEAHYRTAKFAVSAFVIPEYPIGTAVPIVAGLTAIAVLGIVRKKSKFQFRNYARSLLY